MNLLLFAVVALLGLLLRVLSLNLQPLWWDEGYSVFFATSDLATMLARTAIDIHPPFYYLLLQSWMLLFGKSAFALRMLSVVIGIVALPVVYLLAKRLYNSRIAFLASALLAISPFHIYYSQEVRMYSLVTLLGLVSVYLFAQLIGMPKGTTRTAIIAALYIVVTTAALYTQYYAVFLLAFQVIYVVAISISRHRTSIRDLVASLAHWAVAWLLIFVLYLPWLVIAGSELIRYVSAKVRIEQSVPLDPFTFLIQHLVAFSSGHFSNWGWLAVAAILYTMIVLLGSGIPTQLRSRPKYNSISQSPVTGVSRDLLLGLYLLVPLSFAYLVNLFFPFHPIHYERLLLLASPPFFLIAAAGIDRLWQMHIRYGMASLTLLLGFATLSLYDLYTVPRYPDDDYRPLISTLQQGAKPGDILIGIYPWQIGYLETYYEGAPLHVVQADNDSWVSDPQKMEQQLGAWSVNSKRIWLPALQTKGRVLEDALDAYLRPRNYAVLDTWFGTTRLELFALLDDPPVAQTTLHLPDSADKTVHYGFAANQAIVGGDILPVWFDYSEQNESSYKFSLRLDDRAGNVWAQEDREIEKGRQRVGFGIPAGTPPGDYQLLISFYASNNTPSKSSKPEGLGQVNIISPSEPILRAIPKRTRALFENGVELLGYSAGDAPAQPGQTNGIGLYWQSRSSQLSDVEVRIRLDDSKGHSYLISQSVPAHGIYPLPQWKPNEVVFDPHTFQLSGNAPDGTYSVLVGLFDTKTQQIVRTAGTKEWASIGTIEVKARPRYFGRPSPSHPFSADFGGWARLIGYDLVRATEALQIVLYWQALGTPPNSYTVFTHLLGPDGKIRGQRDQIPGDGAYPTTTWVPGEYLIDTYRINSPLLAGDQLEIGMYNPSSGERVPLMDGLNSRQDDHINLPIPSN